MTYYSQDRNTADVRKKRDFGGFAMFCGTFNDAGRIADRQVKSGTVPQNVGHLAALLKPKKNRRFISFLSIPLDDSLKSTKLNHMIPVSQV